YTTTNSVDTTGVTSPAPDAVYQSVRYGNFSYTIPNLAPSTTYHVKLHFDEFYWSTAGSRVFNVSSNNIQVLSNYDIYQAAGGTDKAVVESFTTTSDANGRIELTFTSVTDNAMVSGIEVAQ
ncbi:MAG: malectin domain-containing carbohydrate-binding protein, partial [Candidatus Levyibacteriota bacterium]